MMTRLLARVKGLLRRTSIDAEVEEELRFHVEMETQANLRRGMTPIEAGRAARISLGGLEQIREQVRDERATRLDSLALDLRYAARQYARHKPSTVVGLAVLALGIGINTALFSIVHAFLFQPLPGASTTQLRYVYLRWQQHPERPSGLAYKEYLQLKASTDVFREMCARATDAAVLRTNGEGVQVTGEMVTANYFDVLGVRPVVGRTFTPADEADDAEPTIVISDSLWQSRFNRDTAVLGRTLQLDPRGSSTGHATADLRRYTVVGVIGDRFRGTISRWESAEFWVPFTSRVVDLELVYPFMGINTRTRDGWLMQVVGRLKPGVTDAQAQAALGARDVQWRHGEYPNSQERADLILRGSPVSASLPFEGSWGIVPWRLGAALMIVAGMVLLIAAANLAGIVTARGVVRRGEIAIRLALGASRRRVARQLVTETLVLSLAGGLCAVPVARVLVAAFLAATPAQFGGRFSRLARLSLDVPLDMTVLLFTVLVCVAAGVLIGLAPARQAAKTDLLAALSGTASAASRPVRARLGHWIVLPQVCLSLALLVSAGVLVRTALRAERVGHGYDAEHLAIVEYQLPIITREAVHSAAIDGAKARATWGGLNERFMAFERKLLASAAASPRVVSATLSQVLPWESMRFICSVLAREDYGHALGANRWVQEVDASPGYFDTFGIRIVRGRPFDERDVTSGRPVAIVSEGLARLLWPGREAMGEYLARYDPKDTGSQPPEWREVVGIAADTTPLFSEASSRPSAYFPLRTRNFGSTLVIRGERDPRQLLRSLVDTVKRADDRALVLAARTGREAIDESLYPRRMAAAILAICGLAGLFLAGVGIYGVMSYSVAQRVREIGIRSALGAERKDILRLVIGEGVRVIVIGSVAGLALAIAAMRMTSSFVVAVPIVDGLTFAAVCTFLAAVILLACYLPARRAARVDPAAVLRAE